MISDLFLQQVDSGRTGRNQGFTMGMPKLEEIVDGNTAETYTLIYAGTGNGKSSFALYSYVYRPIVEHFNDDKFRVTYFSLEMSKITVLARLLSLHLFDEYGVNISPKEIFSRKKNYILCDEYYQLVKESMPWLDKLCEKVIIYDATCNADYIYQHLISNLKLTGEFKKIDGKTVYVPNDPELIHNVVIDHIGLVKPSAGNSLKDEIDAVSRVLVQLRNETKISPVVIMQINRESGNIERRKQGLNNLTLNDVKDSGNPTQDCNIAISIFNPFREKLASYNKYDIKKLEDSFRVLTVQKARDGASSVEIGVNFFGRNGYWHELPRPDEINDYDKYLTPNYILGESIDTSNTDIPEVKDTIKNNFKFVM